MTTTEDRIRDSCQRAHGVGYVSTLAIRAAAAVADAMVAEAVAERDVLILTLTGKRDNLRESIDALTLRVEGLEALLRSARDYVDDAGGDEDPETQRMSAALLADIDAALLARSEAKQAEGGEQ